MRCICCDSVMSASDLLRKNPITQEFEDFCGRCLNTLREINTPYSMRYEADENCIGAGAWLEALVHSDLCEFEHEFKNLSEKQ